MEEMILAYISGPISAPDIDTLDANIQRGSNMAKRVWELGYGAHCPHLNTGFAGAEKIPHAQYMAFDLRILRACDVVIMLDGWEKSVVAEMEFREAMTLNIPVFYENDKDLAIKLANLDYELNGVIS